MAHSLSQIYIHLVFHTKTINLRREHLPRLWAYIAGVAISKGSIVIRVGGEPNHVHILCTLPRTMSVSDLTEEIKRSSSHWIKTIAAEYAPFSWQPGYAVFSVSQSKVEKVTTYIENQEEHHKKVSYQDEYVQWLKEYGIEYDEKYLWT